MVTKHDPGGEDAWIEEAATARLLRAAVESLPGVRADSCRVSPLDRTGTGRLPLSGDGPPGVPLRVQLELTADWRWSRPELAEAVRERVLAAARDRAQLEVGMVEAAVTGVPGSGEAWPSAAPRV